MSDVDTAAGGEALTLKKVLGPIHIWGLGVGIVLVGEFMGWNFTVEKGAPDRCFVDPAWSSHGWP